MGYPAVARNADGRLEAFVEGSDGALYHRWQTSAGAGWANNPDGSRAWPSLGGSVTSPPAAISNGDGRLEVFARDSSGNIAHRWQASASGGWNPDGWQHIGSGNFAGWVSVGRNAGDGHLEVFAGGVDGKIYHSYQANGQPGGWTPWAQL